MRTNKLFIFCALFLSVFFETADAQTTPAFLNPGPQHLTICENIVNFNLNSYLAVVDSASFEEWYDYSGPSNGSLSSYYDIEYPTGDTVSPTSLFYSPNTGFSGNDTLIIAVYNGSNFAYDTFYFTIKPVANPGTIIGTSPVCVGSAAAFTDSTLGGRWISRDTVGTVDSFGNVTGVAPGVDTILYILGNSCGFDTATYVTIVSASYYPSVSILANPGDTSCEGAAVTYVAVPVHGGASPAYQWYVNGTLLAATDTFIYTPSDGDNISCTLTSDAPCLLQPSATVLITATVIPNITPVITISSLAYGDTVCIGTTVPYTATVVNGGTSPSYLWSVNGTPYSVGSTFYYSPSDGDTITCLLTSNHSCVSPAVVGSNPIIMTVDTSELPVVKITADPGDTVCLGSPVTFTANTTYGGLSPFYRWAKNGVNVATGVTFSIIPNAGDLVYCLLSSSASCRSLDSVFSNTIEMAVDSPIIPTVAISSFSGKPIAGGLDTIVAAVTSAIDPTYQWEINGTPIPGATSGIYVAKDTTATFSSITCVVTSHGKCIGTGTSNAIVIANADVSVQQISTSGTSIQLLPNPNKGNFTIVGTLSSDIKEVTLEVTDIVGRVVYKEVIGVQNGVIQSSIALDNQATNGIYLAHIVAANINDVIRFTLSR